MTAAAKSLDRCGGGAYAFVNPRNCGKEWSAFCVRIKKEKNMTKMKSVLTLAVVCLAVVAVSVSLAACGGAKAPAKLVGTWESTLTSAITLKIESGKITQTAGAMGITVGTEYKIKSVKDNEITVQAVKTAGIALKGAAKYEAKFKYELSSDGKTLTLSSEDLTGSAFAGTYTLKE
jgi:hypothetical protein